MTMFLSALTALVWLSGSPVANSAVPGEAHAAKTAYQTNHNKWQALGWTNYDFIVQRQCYCLEDYTREMRVAVRAGKVVSASFSDNQQAVGDKILSDIKTINAWFDLISNELNRPADIVAVDYHSDYGYPQKIHIDIHPRIADDEQVVQIKQLENRQ